MAQNIGEAQINLSVNTSQMEREVSAALKRLESKGFNLGGGINARAFTQPLGRITGAANEFQKSLDASNARVIAFGASAGAIYNVQRAFTALIGSTIEVQKALTDINVILNASNKTLGQFGDQLFQIARDTGQAFSTVATAAGELARQGLSIEQTLKRTSDALVLARLSGLDAASSVEALTASINSFNNAALDSTQIVNKLASVDAAFAVSSADLAEALKRVGSSAQDVGVSFDELLAIVASVNQTTARGGAVIGNSLKTIFTRVQRTDVLDQLQALGIAVRDLNGNTAPAIQILTGLAQKFDQLGSAQRAQVAELVGGVFQINVLKAALGDLSREYSIYGNALKIATNASDEAIRRNEELNKTLAALVNRTVANLTKAGSEIGALSFAPAIERVLGTINTVLENFDVKGDSIGSKIGRGIFEGIGSFISGPGIALLIGVFIKIFGDLAKFTIEASKTILSLNKSSQSQAQIQERINNILAQNPQLVQNILNKQVSLLQVEKDILTVIQAQAQARQQSGAIAATITRGLVGRGITSEKGVITPRTKSQGFIPNFNANKEIMGAISGGYMPGQVRSMNIPNYGRITYNTAEEIKKFPGLSQPGIMPPERSDAGKAYKQKFKDKYGIDPYASKGFIPNFALSASKIAARLRQGKMTEQEAARLGYRSTKQKQADKPASSGIPIQSASPLLALRSTGGKQGYTFKPKDGPQVNVTFPVIPFNQESTGFKLTDLRTNLDKVIDKSISDFATSIYKSRQLNPPIDLPSTIEQARKQADGLSGSIEGTIGGIFESAFRAAFGRSVKATKGGANFDVARIPKDLGIFFPGATTGIPGDFKSSDSDENRRSMALKILSNQAPSLYSALTKRSAAQGFIPNFSPIEKAMETEKVLGGKGVLDYKPGFGFYVRDGKTQPNFAAVMRDHPEGLQKATKNSRMMQDNLAKGFIPNFAPLDPSTLFYLTSSLFMGGAGQMNQSGADLQLAEKRLGELLNQRGEIEYQILNTSKQGAKNRRRLNQLEAQRVQIEDEITSQRRSINNQTPIFARRGGQFVGGIGGVASRFGSRFGPGLALAAPIATGIASQFIGDDYTREGRGTRSIVQGLGTTASFAGLGFMVGGVPGAIGGAAIGGIMATYDAIKQFKDVMPEVARNVELATEKFNGITSSTQAISVALESMKSAQENTGLSADTRAQLLNKANQDFAEGLSKLAEISKEKTEEIISLYSRMGDTAEVRTKIAMLQGEAKKELDIETARLNLLKANQLFKEATDPNLLVQAGSYLTRFGTPDYKARFGSEPGGPKANLNPLEQRQADAAARNLADNFSSILTNSISRRQGAPAGSKFDLNLQDIQSLQNALNKEGLDGLKKTILGIAEIDSEAEYINFLLEGTDLNLLKSALEKLNFKIKKMDDITKARAEFEAREAAGTTTITSQEQLSRLFNRGTIPQTALQNIDYEAIFGKTSTLQGQYNQLVGQEAMKNLMDLNTELANSPDKLKLLQQYTEEVARVQDDLSKGIITTSQAFERLKNKVDSLTFDKLAKGMFTGERADLRQTQLQQLLKQGNFTEGFQPLLSFYDRLGDNAITTADKINKSFANLAENMQTGFEDAFGAFLDGTKTAEDAFRDFALSLAQQTIKEQFSIGFRSLLGQLTGGGGAGTGYGGLGSGGLLGNLFSGLFGLGKAKGGPIKKYSGGGYVDGGSGVRDDVPAMLTDGEYVLRKSAVNKYGIDALNMLNSGGMIKGYAGGGAAHKPTSSTYFPSRFGGIFSLLGIGTGYPTKYSDNYFGIQTPPRLNNASSMIYGGIRRFQQDYPQLSARLNPFNIGLKDYSSQNSFNKAFSSARNDLGDNSKFLYQGKRYSTMMRGEFPNLETKKAFNSIKNVGGYEKLLDMYYASGAPFVNTYNPIFPNSYSMPSPIGKRASYTMFSNIINSANLGKPLKLYQDIFDEIPHAFQYNDKLYNTLSLPSFFGEQMLRIYQLLTTGKESVYNMQGTFENEAHYVIQKKMAEYMMGNRGDKFSPSMIRGWNKGGRIKGYATGGSINSLLANAYDFFGPEGDRLTGSFSPEAFKTEVTGPEQLDNIPALTGRFNISDFLSSRAITNEENPMVALRDQRFQGMQNYQQQVSNFKTSYNEQMRQVEELRKQEQERVNQINAANRAAYNAQRSQLLIGGLIGVGTSFLGGLSATGKLPGLSSITNLLGIGGGGGSYNPFGDIFNRGLNFLQQGLTGGFSPNYATGGKSPFDLTEDQRKQVAKSIESGQFRGGMQDPFFQQAQLFPQFGRGQTGIGYAPGGGFGMQPTSSFGGFQYNVGLGTPAGFQTQTQSLQDYYRVNFASPVSPIFPGRGNLMVATNPYDTRGAFYTNAFGGFGFAKGGPVKGYRVGGDVADMPLPNNLTFKGSDGKTYRFSDLGITKYSDIGKAGQAFAGGYNSPELIYLLGQIQQGLGGQFNRVTAVNDLYHMTRRDPGTSHRTGYKADFTLNDYKNGRENIIKYLDTLGLKQGRDYSLVFEGPGTPGSTGTHFDFKLNKDGITKVASLMSGMPYENLAGMGLPGKTAVQDYLNLPLNTAFPGAVSTNIAGTNISTIGPQANPFTRTNPITRSLTPDGPSRTDMPYVGSRRTSTNIPAAQTPMGGIPAAVTAATATTAVTTASQIPSLPPGATYRSPIAYSMGEDIIINPTKSPALPPPMLNNTRATTQSFAENIMNRIRDPLGLFPSKGGIGKGSIPTIFPSRDNIPTIGIPANASKATAQKAAASSTQVNLPVNSQTQLDLNDPIIKEYLKTPSQLYEEAAQASLIQLPYFRDMKNMIDMATGNAPTLYQTVGSLLDIKNKGMYGNLASRFAPFYGGQNNRMLYQPTASNFGQVGFNNYLKYLGLNPFSTTLSQLNAFRAPLTPSTLGFNPFGFASRYFSGFGGFTSTGVPFSSSNYFGTGSRLGIQPDWVARASGGMIYGGTSYKDDVPAMLMGGEYVIRKDVVDRMGQPFFDKLNRGQVSGFADGGPVGTALPALGVGGTIDGQDNSKTQFVEALMKLLKSLDQLNKSVEEQTRETKSQNENMTQTTDQVSSDGGGVTNNININVNVDQGGQVTDTKSTESQEGQQGGEGNDQERFKKTLERSRVLSEMLRQQVLKVIVEEQRPGGVLYQGSKGRDLGR